MNLYPTSTDDRPIPMEDLTKIVADIMDGVPYLLDHIGPETWNTLELKYALDEAFEHDPVAAIVGSRNPVSDLCLVCGKGLLDLSKFSRWVRVDGSQYSIGPEELNEALWKLWNKRKGDQRWIPSTPLELLEGQDAPEMHSVYLILFAIMLKNGYAWYYVDQTLFCTLQVIQEFRSLRESSSHLQLPPVDQLCKWRNEAEVPTMVKAFLELTQEFPIGYPLEPETYLTVLEPPAHGKIS